MADLPTLEKALRNADRAGDEAAAKRFASEISKLKSAAPAPQQQYFEELPWYQKLATAADDTARLIASGATFGFADKLSGYMGGEGTEAERQKTEAARERAGSAGTVSEVGGAIAAPAALAGKGLTLAGRLGTKAAPGIMGLAARSGLMGVEGAGYGALTALGNDEDIGKGTLYGAAGGVAGNVVGEAISAGVNKAAGIFNKKPNIPSPEDLEGIARAARQRADASGVAYTPAFVDKLNSKVVSDLTDIGYHPKTMPGASAAVEEIQKLQGQNITLSGLDTVRKIASGGYIPGNKQNNLAISKIINAIDDAADTAGSADILMGKGDEAAQALREARNAESRLFKIQRVEDAVEKADLRAASTGSGGNVDNATRQNLRRIMEKPRGFSADEKEALETAIRGTPTQNALRLAGKLSPSGNGLMAALGVGGAMVNPAIGVFSLGGMGAKALADRGTQQNVQKLVEILRAGGDASATKAAPNAVQRLSQSKREALARALMAIGAHEAGTPAR